MKRHYNLINQAEHCVEIFFEVIGQPFEPHKRHRNHLMPRAAIGVALSRLVGDEIAAHALEKDRTTLIHYRHKHKTHMMYHEGYSTLFETALNVVDSYMNETAKVDRIRYIDNAIKILIKEKEEIQSKLNV